MDNDFSTDRREAAEAIATHDVITMRFVSVGYRLLLDFRSTDIDGPLVRLVEPVRSVQERCESLRQIRPRFALPERLVAVSWPGFARSLGESEAWREVMKRIVESGHPDSVRSAENTLMTLERQEREHQANAIQGDGFRTLWSAAAPKS